jgi:hypothetical protein
MLVPRIVAAKIHLLFPAGSTAGQPAKIAPSSQGGLTVTVVTLHFARIVHNFHGWISDTTHYVEESLLVQNLRGLALRIKKGSPHANYYARWSVLLNGVSAGCDAMSNTPSALSRCGDENPHACGGFHLPIDRKTPLHCYPKRGHHYSNRREHHNQLIHARNSYSIEPLKRMRRLKLCHSNIGREFAYAVSSNLPHEIKIPFSLEAKMLI